MSPASATTSSSVLGVEQQSQGTSDHRMIVGKNDLDHV